ncbi:hypothetical protein WIC_04737 [Escherichia coli KTE112]|nr:hypothetical protein A13W_03510 [Escherichia coli KTE193]ELI19036.1 hypothetical protein WIC_04737 [Escherichia coli KTE112]
MFSRVLALLAVLLLSANTWAAIEINNHQARGNDSNLLIVFYVQIMPDDFVMQLHRF